MSKVIAIAKQKGGVCKTTTALNIAAGMIKAGTEVCTGWVTAAGADLSHGKGKH